MKKLSLLLVASISLAQFANAATSSKTSTTSIPHPNLHQVNVTLKSEYQQVQSGLKSGKVSASQGSTLKASLKSIRQQEVGFLKQNSNHELTATQTSQLNASLAAVEQTLTTAGVPAVTTTTR